jgi:hypothetical protein
VRLLDDWIVIYCEVGDCARIYGKRSADPLYGRAAGKKLHQIDRMRMSPHQTTRPKIYSYLAKGSKEAAFDQIPRLAIWREIPSQSSVGERNASQINDGGGTPALL